jgi:hypothetical protein
MLLRTVSRSRIIAGIVLVAVFAAGMLTSPLPAGAMTPNKLAMSAMTLLSSSILLLAMGACGPLALVGAVGATWLANRFIFKTPDRRPGAAPVPVFTPADLGPLINQEAKVEDFMKALRNRARAVSGGNTVAEALPPSGFRSANDLNASEVLQRYEASYRAYADAVQAGNAIEAQRHLADYQKYKAQLDEIRNDPLRP